jgi:cell division protease FtsH
LARRMVCDWGMSELGPLSFGKKEEQIFLGREIAQHRDYSEATAIRIDEQVRKLVEQGYQKAHKIIEDNAAALERVAMALLEREVLDQSEVRLLVEGKELAAFTPAPKPTPPGDGAQQVIKPETPRRVPGMLEGGPQPA